MDLDRNLILTSSHMKGDDVRALQNQLKKRGWYKGDIDGEYGPLTAQAVYRAWYKLGKLKPNHIAGPGLYRYLTGTKTTKAMQATAKLRGRKTKKRVERRIALARKMISLVGLTEKPPNSNKNRVTIWYSKVIAKVPFFGPWCAMVITWCLWHIVPPWKIFRYAYVPFIVNDATAGRKGLVRLPKSLVSIITGTVICFDWQSDKSVADHVGVGLEEAWFKREYPRLYLQAVRDFGPLRSGEFWTVEGNTGIGNDSNGGEQMIRQRNLNFVEALVQI